MDKLTPEIINKFLETTYQVKDDARYQDALDFMLQSPGVTKVNLIQGIDKLLKSGKAIMPKDSTEAVRFLNRLPLPQFRIPSILDKVSPQDKSHVTAPSSFWAPQASITAGILDFPRKKLPEAVWRYEEDEPLPKLRKDIRAEILKEARYRLSLMGARLIGANLYGGSAGYQYHEGADIDVSLYIDWEDFKGDPEIMEQTFKQVEIPWHGFVIHMFVKPEDQPEQVEVADAAYNVIKDEWIIPPLVLPGDFDPEIYFKPMIELAEKKAQKIDELMGHVQREWAKLKNAAESLTEDTRDPDVVKKRLEIQKKSVSRYVDKLVAEFAEVWTNRKKMHDQLRTKYINNRDVGKYERFQPAEITWKYLDQSGYVEFLKVLAKAHKEGVIDQLLAMI